jgi:hypothetical protein
MSGTFCQVCRHELAVGTGHEENCPVLTGQPVIGINPQDLYYGAPIGQHPFQQGHQYLQQGQAGMLSQGPFPHEQPGSVLELITRMRLLCDLLEERVKSGR